MVHNGKHDHTATGYHTYFSAVRDQGRRGTDSACRSQWGHMGTDETGRDKLLHVAANRQPQEPATQESLCATDSGMRQVGLLRNPRTGLVRHKQEVGGYLGGCDLVFQAPLHSVHDLSMFGGRMVSETSRA